MTGMPSSAKPTTLAQLRESGWQSKTVKNEIRDNFIAALARGDELFPGIIGYDDTVVPEINNALIAGHDILFLGEKGQAKSRLMRLIARFLDAELPYLDFPECPVHEDPYHPITRVGRELVASRAESEIPIAWWPRDERYAERLAPGTKFADIIGEIDPAKLAGGASLSAEEALYFGLIPRLHRGIFALNELPDLDELVQVGLFNILEERDVQIRGYPIKFDINVLILFSANPTTYNRSGKVIPQLKDRIGSSIQTHYPRERDRGIEIMKQEADIELDGHYPVVVPPFMEEIIEQISICARKSKYVDHQSGVSARISIANYRTMVANARQRAIRGSATWATCTRRAWASWSWTRWAATRCPSGRSSTPSWPMPSRSSSPSTWTSTGSARSPTSSAAASRSRWATCCRRPPTPAVSSACRPLGRRPSR
jgi:magnesium chelatase subunit I